MRNFLMVVLLVVLATVCRAQHALVHVETKEDDSGEATVEDFSGSTDDVFVATDNWQEIRAGQAVPRGLHIRINMQTGKKEGKLLEQTKERDAEKKGALPASLDPEVLKQALKNIKSDFASGEVSSTQPNENLRTLDELKRDFKAMEMDIKTDYEVMVGLFESYASAATDEERSNVVENLEFYVHQYDNAVDFVHMNGIERIVKPSLNASSERLREMACFLVGSASQSNPKVQIAGLEAGLVNLLLKLIALDTSPKVSLKALYALSALLRHFPGAQHSFLTNGGLDVLKQVFEREEASSSSSISLFAKLRIKILTLLHDLLEERRDENLSSESGQLKMEQYSRIDMARIVKETGWCQVFQSVLILPRDDRRARRDDVLSTVSEEYPVRAEHDNLEKILAAMLQMEHSCRDHFRANQDLMEKLTVLSSQYQELSEKERAQEESDNYFSQILGMLNTLLPTSHTSLKTEL